MDEEVQIVIMFGCPTVTTFRQKKLWLFVCIVVALAWIDCQFKFLSLGELPQPSLRAFRLIQAVYESPISIDTERLRLESLARRPPLEGHPPASIAALPFTPLLNVLKAWNPDNVDDVPVGFTEVLQHFDFENITERGMAEQYRDAELPFKLFNIPDLNKASSLWSDSYLSRHLKSSEHTSIVEKSQSNHFMFWKSKGNNNKGLKSRDRRDFEPPTDFLDNVTFDDWLHIAREADKIKIPSNATHLYFMTSSAPPGTKSGFEDSRSVVSTFIDTDLPWLAAKQSNFFTPMPELNKGIQCRFGMRGIVAAAHYDAGRNFVAMLRGEKRYILASPKSCRYLSIIGDKHHPSFRHSTIDWSDMEEVRQTLLQSYSKYDFSKVEAIDTIVRSGEMLYIPSYWFHYIVSLRLSIQCNSRFGAPPNKQGLEDVQQCMQQQY